MGFRFRKSIKLFPGVKLNLSKTGISATIGKSGASVNISSRGTRGTVGIPGTGLSYSEKLSQSPPSGATEQASPSSEENPGMGLGALLGWGMVVLVVLLVVSGFVSK